MPDVADTLTFRTATSADVPAIVRIVNAAYRGDTSRAGWTTEADLLEGLRTDETEVATLVAGPDSTIVLCFRGDVLVGSVTLRRADAVTAHLGMLVVEPVLQDAGIGKRIMARAEEEVRARWQSRAIVMSVITARAELIEFYERRGYRRTGRTHPFPDAALSVPTVAGGLLFEDLEKPL